MNNPTSPSVIIPPAPTESGPTPPQPPICTPEQEANGTCKPPARQPDEPPTDE